MRGRSQLASAGREEGGLLSFGSFLSLYLHHSGRESIGPGFPTLEELKRDYINYLLDITEDNLEEVADILCLPKKRLSQKLNQYQL